MLQYKKLTALILLLLQVFISTPVQLYHHHNYLLKSTENNHQNEYSALLISSASKNDDVSHTTVTEVCLICNHQYTAYYNDNVFEDIKPVKQQPWEHYTHYKQNCTLAFAENPSNKSPPASI